jgi:LmbE family N-acetylglucosaminyl deacetylase
MTWSWPDTRHIYLSPHLDDAVLSCGGTILSQVGRGDSVAVVTVFAASPPLTLPLSSFAQELHARWQASAPQNVDFSDPPAVRRAEDRAALAVLSPVIHIFHYGLTDCIYRMDSLNGQPIYPDEQSIMGLPQPSDPALVDLRDVPPLPSDSALYVPLSVGGHVDHRVVRTAVEGWGIPSSQVLYYEDYPYVAEQGFLEKTLGDLDGWDSVLIPLSEEALSVKARAIAAYSSQIGTFWGSEEEMKVALREQSLRAGGGERLWVRV